MTPTVAHLRRELERLDLLLHREVLRLRARYQLSLDEFRGLYVSDEQVDALLAKTVAPDCEVFTEQAEAIRRRNQTEVDVGCSWALLAAEFGLTDFEQDVLLLALAPEFDLKYETLYGYLNNDITRKWPTRDLALRVFSTSEDRLLHWERLAFSATLFDSGLLQPVSGALERVSGLAVGFSPAQALSRYLIAGANASVDRPLARLAPTQSWENLHTSAALISHLRRSIDRLRTTVRPPVVILEGAVGSGRQTAARLISTELGRPAFSLDAGALRLASEAGAPPASAISLQVRLAGGTLFLRNSEAFFDAEGRPLPEALRFVSALLHSHVLVLLACAPGISWRDLLAGRRTLAFSLEPPECADRRHLWHRAAESHGLHADDPTLDSLSQRFRFTPGQIAAAVEHAADLPPENVHDVLFAAARGQSDQRLGKLAVKIASSFSWGDLVLPPATLRRVREAAQAIENRHTVGVEWGMRPGSAAMSLNILFSGPSGTGKTMTAGIIARHVGLELYRCDLSGIVSKYIGETEKNLDRIFSAARQSHAILFFDEADALFGKRSEVKDAHDRYANIEVSYLLQKMEEHDGVVILATNLSKNIDVAFTRRLQYVVEFPSPTEVHREQLWRSMFPERAPLANDVDFSFLARQFELTGGQIRNITIDAAFLAAADGQRMTMPLMVKAVGRHLLKTGRLPSATEFKEYFSLLSEVN